MILDLLRDKMANCGKSQYRVSADSGVDKANLCRIMQGGTCKAETIDKLMDYFGLEVVEKKRKAR